MEFVDRMMLRPLTQVIIFVIVNEAPRYLELVKIRLIALATPAIDHFLVDQDLKTGFLNHWPMERVTTYTGNSNFE